MEIKDTQDRVLFQCEGRPRTGDLDRLDLRNANLRGADLTGLLFTETDFPHADLRGGKLLLGFVVLRQV